MGRDRDRLAAAAADGPGAVRVRTRRVGLTDPDAVAAADVAGPVTAVGYAAGLFDRGAADGADPDAWARLVEVTLTAAMRVSRLLPPGLIAAAPASLVLLGSAAGLSAFRHDPAYVAGKHGLVGFARATFARATFLDVRDRGVRVTVVDPGLVAAGAGPRAGADPAGLLQPADVAAAVLHAVTAPPHVGVTGIDLHPPGDPAP